MQPKFDQNKKKIEILTLSPGYDGIVKKTILRYCLFKDTVKWHCFTVVNLCVQRWIYVHCALWWFCDGQWWVWVCCVLYWVRVKKPVRARLYSSWSGCVLMGLVYWDGSGCTVVGLLPYPVDALVLAASLPTSHWHKRNRFKKFTPWDSHSFTYCGSAVSGSRQFGRKRF